ncbi:putative molybdenum cofactor biosynthesis protein B [Megasphaera hutchinsoni]|uniref:Molybdenum cofactor biosynthesis protein B n=1 Tax=Megasphaera hutchinsoni TaxID=1588748 RepID=A0A134CLN9_9FIRM|nr:putative molybdenum cofactor biosynthesis protein B [Megasphaera hutchinsoni]
MQRNKGGSELLERKGERPLRTAILTISNSRTFSDDTNGLMIQSALTNYGHHVVDYAIVKDDRDAITRHIHEWVCSVDMVITSGGTGLAERDVTLETLTPMMEKTIPGFAEMLLFFAYRRSCGVEALAYRSVAGLIHQCLVFALPGLPSLIKIGMEQIILPEANHLYGEIKK